MKKFLRNLSHKKNLIIRKIKNQNKSEIVLISDVFHPRVVKIAYALRKKNYRVILLCKNTPNNEGVKKLINYFDEVNYYNTPQEALVLAIKYKPLVYHIFSCYTYDTPEFLIKSNIGKIVFDNYDGLQGFIKSETIKSNDWMRGQEVKEQFCLENADGLCCRSLETQYQKRKFGYKYKGERILFLDYCWNNSTQGNKASELTNLEEMHIVYIGGMAVEKEQPDSPLSYHLWLAEALASQKIHYHIYPSYNLSEKGFNDKFSDYIELEKKTPYFHLHKKRDYIELLNKITQYSYGIIISSRKVHPIEGAGHTIEKHDYAMGNKFFDYIDAELPIIISSGKFINWLFKRQGVSVNITEESLTNKLDPLKEKLPELAENIRECKKYFCITENIPRLIKFYEAIQ